MTSRLIAFSPLLKSWPSIAGDRGRDAVVEARGVALDEAVVALDAPPGREVEPAVEGAQQLRDLLRLVLAVGIHEHDDVAAGALEAGLQRGRLPVVPAQAQAAARCGWILPSSAITSAVPSVLPSSTTRIS